MGDSHHIERLHTNELEIGVTEAVQRHISRHVVDTPPVTQRKLDFEHRRPRWLREMAAEATGVFFYVYPGIAATASFFLNETNPAFGSIFQIGWAYAIGIAFAIITCATVSGGHFNPAITICFAIWQGFPWKKVPMYIFAQVFGAFMAGMILMAQYHVQITAFEAASAAKGLGNVYNGGPASILCSFPSMTPIAQTNQGYLFLIEFFVDSYIGLVLWTVLDPANPFVAPASAPFTIGLAYGVMVWGFADITISTNLARDLGTRIVAAIFYGGEVFSYNNGYSWISVLVNVPATIFATGFYELLMRDSLDKIGKGHASHEQGEEGLARHLTNTGKLENGTTGMLRGKQNGEV